MNTRCGHLWWLINDKTTGKPIVYHANGYLGKFMIIFPSLKLVVVRTMTQERWKSDMDDFVSIYQLAGKIIK